MSMLTAHRPPGSSTRVVPLALARLIAVFTAVLLAATPLLTAPAQAAPTNAPADDLRVTLNRLGQEHVYLAGAAFSAAVAGRQDEFKVAGDAVELNTQELGKAVGSPSTGRMLSERS